MSSTQQDRRRLTAGMIGLILVQLFCAVFFVVDVIGDYQALGAAAVNGVHFYVETAATVSLIAAIFIESRMLLALLQRQAHLEGKLDQARAAIHDVLLSLFEDWRLTRSEADVANFVVKGFSTTEIAELRGTTEATVKSHLNAIYRKAGVRNRSELLSKLMDALMVGERMDKEPPESPDEAMA